MKKLILGVVVMCAAILTTAATNQLQMDTGYIVNEPGNNPAYRSTLDDSNCSPGPKQPCSFEILAPTEVPSQSSYTPEEMELYLQNNWIAPSEKEGVYND